MAFGGYTNDLVHGSAATRAPVGVFGMPPGGACPPHGELLLPALLSHVHREGSGAKEALSSLLGRKVHHHARLPIGAHLAVQVCILYSQEQRL